MQTPTLARALGYGGLLPFVALAAAVFAGGRPLGIDPLAWLAGYAATILSFVGAVHWGMVVGAPGMAAQGRHLVASVVPALVAWVALGLPAVSGLWLFVAGFAGWYGWERGTAWEHYPGWYRELRTALTSAVSLTLAAVALLAV